MRIRQLVLSPIVVFAFLSAAGLGGIALTRPRPLELKPKTALASAPTSNRREVVLVLIGSSFCAGMRQAGFRPAFLAARDTVAKRVRQAGRILVTIGVSIDWDPEVGVALLKSYGPFDELAVGANWENIGAVDYIWNDKGVAAVPQVVVLERSVNDDGRVISYGPDRVLLRLAGMPDLQSWMRAGGPLNFEMHSNTLE
jgi:hypothetical protein